MKIEPLNLTPPINGVNKSLPNPQNSLTPVNGKDNGNGDELTKTQRLPRWTRQEILTLIQGKRLSERAKRVGSEFGPGQTGPKWSTISSYCRKHGVDRGPVQCRKRWSNLAGDFKKIKEFELRIGDESESFWCMRNDLRREKKLPGFFDKEVYDILYDGGGGDLVVETESGFDSGRSVGVDEEGTPCRDIPAPTPISVGTFTEREPALDGEGLGSTKGGKKRKLFTPDEDEEAIQWQQHLIKTLERNGTLLRSQLEAQTNHFESEREQQKDHANNLVAVLSKVADALGKIADKL